MTSVNQNFSMYQNETKVVTITVTDADGVAVALAGATIVWRMRVRRESASNTLEKTTASGAITIAANTFTFTLATGDTDDVAPGMYYHEAEVTDASGNVAIVSLGYITIYEAVNA